MIVERAEEILTRTSMGHQNVAIVGFLKRLNSQVEAGVVGGAEVLKEITEDDRDHYRTVEQTINESLLASSTTVLSTTGAGDLQVAIDALSDGDVLEVDTDATYDPVVIPGDVAMVIRAASGRTPTITGQYGIGFADGARDVVISGLTIDGCSTGNVNCRGSSVGLAEDMARVENVILHKLTISNTSNGSAVVFSPNWSSYVEPLAESQFSRRVSIVECSFLKASKDHIEGASIVFRNCEDAYVKNCRIDVDEENGRGIVMTYVKNSLIDGCEVENANGNGEGIKIDSIGGQTYLNTVMIMNNFVTNTVEGIDVDDFSKALVINNLVTAADDEGICVDDSGEAVVIGNTCYGCDVGIRAEAGSVADIRGNTCFGNRVNFRIQNGDELDPSNSTDPAGRFVPVAPKVAFVPKTPSDWDGQVNTISDALNELASRVKALEP